MPKKENFLEGLKCRVPEGLGERLTAIAKKKNSTQAQIIRDALTDYLERHEGYCAVHGYAVSAERTKPTAKPPEKTPIPKRIRKKGQSAEAYGGDTIKHTRKKPSKVPGDLKTDGEAVDPGRDHKQ